MFGGQRGKLSGYNSRMNSFRYARPDTLEEALALLDEYGAEVNEAAGAAIRDLPLTPERIWRAI
jgi:hypothetical protein